MFSLDDVIKSSIELNLFLTDDQKKVLCLLKEKRVYDNFFKVCRVLKRKELSSQEFFSLIGIKDVSDEMLTLLSREEYKGYLDCYSEYISVYFKEKIKRKTQLYEKYMVIKENFPNLSTEDNVETTESLLYFASKSRSNVRRLCIYLSSLDQFGIMEYKDVYRILNNRS